MYYSIIATSLAMNNYIITKIYVLNIQKNRKNMNDIIRNVSCSVKAEVPKLLGDTEVHWSRGNRERIQILREQSWRDRVEAQERLSQ